MRRGIGLSSLIRLATLAALGVWLLGGLCVDHRARRYPSRPERPGDGLAPGRLFPPGHMALVCSPRQARCEQGRPVNCGSGPGR